MSQDAAAPPALDFAAMVADALETAPPLGFHNEDYWGSDRLNNAGLIPSEIKAATTPDAMEALQAIAQARLDEQPRGVYFTTGECDGPSQACAYCCCCFASFLPCVRCVFVAFAPHFRAGTFSHSYLPSDLLVALTCFPRQTPCALMIRAYLHHSPQHGISSSACEQERPYRCVGPPAPSTSPTNQPTWT